MKSEKKEKLFQFFNFKSKKARLMFIIFTALFGLLLLGSVASTITGDMNWFLWVLTAIFGCISCAIYIFKGGD